MVVLPKVCMIKPDARFQMIFKFHGTSMTGSMWIWSILIATTVILITVMVGLFVHFLMINLMLQRRVLKMTETGYGSSSWVGLTSALAASNGKVTLSHSLWFPSVGSVPTWALLRNSGLISTAATSAGRSGEECFEKWMTEICIYQRQLCGQSGAPGLPQS